MLKDKYQNVLELEKKLEIKNPEIQEIAGKVKFTGIAAYQLDKDVLWDAIKSTPGWENEVQADFKVANTDILGFYTVKTGDTLSKIAKKFLENEGRYTEIFNLNKDLLTNPDQIQVGQRLKIPNK